MSAPPTPTGETIVYLDSNYHPLPSNFFPAPHTYTAYPHTPLPQIAPRILPATILLTSLCPLTRETLSLLPPSQLKLIIITSVGTNHVDLAYCAEKNIQVSNMPDTNTDTVAEHALALYFAVNRDVVSMHEWTMKAERWASQGTGILGMNTWEGGGARSCRSEVVGILLRSAKQEFLNRYIESREGGDNAAKLDVDLICWVDIWNRSLAISNLCTALGMKVLISERKSIPQVQARAGRAAFSSILTECTTIILACPLSPETKNLIAAPELSLMRRDAILVNVARGGVVNEADLARALDEGEILGAATDVFESEPVEKGGSPLVRGEGEERVRNLIVSPHVAWFGRDSQEKCVRAIAEIFEGYLKGEKVNFVV
ncbi:hypothetical protein BOTNAR_0193g00160 [Botryotinia narcissicola]|uniref:D-isomer specific 2-hydroxyacid dehydrogenase NAD-binding domain-containing protein n=1 Tax=Botryotinia narcissicola TaxID=278944 RepID=A0A4Z1I8A5_9HELO|nr:hypothetical protein BOTNAR_0193g00160 [Botryotinia narcissicola]